MRDPARFFQELRRAVLGPTLSQGEVDGVEALLAAAQDWPVAWAAYALGTAYHETAHTMLPVKERGGEHYFHRMYDPQGLRPHIAAQLGNTEPGDGVAYCGRGYVQLTGRANYARAGAATGLPLIEQPSLAERSDVAASILRWGMTEGWFTGRRLEDYLPRSGPATKAQFKGARRIINGSDRDVLIAGFANDFQTALTAGGWP